MKRRIRRLFDLLCAFSLLLSLLTIVLWVRGHYVADHFSLVHRGGRWEAIRSAGGILGFQFTHIFQLYPDERPLIAFEYSHNYEVTDSNPMALYRPGPNQDVRQLGDFSYVWVTYGPVPSPEEAQRRRERLAAIREEMELTRRTEGVTADAFREQQRAEYVQLAQERAQLMGGGFMRQLNVPAWFVLLLTVALPAIWLYSFVRARRVLPGHCRDCGYDLRASTDGCPECGKLIEAVTAE